MHKIICANVFMYLFSQVLFSFSFCDITYVQDNVSVFRKDMSRTCLHNSHDKPKPLTQISMYYL